ncbi:MAG: PAS domain S-box protein [Sedimentisphaerales bacterium]|nr:PAS domain S-box protein [Sedimentisphaerales bacterium]
MKHRPTIFVKEHVLVLAAGLAVFYWFLEAWLDAFIFFHTDFFDAIFPSNPNEQWMRGLICCLFIALGIYAHRAIKRQKQAQTLLAESETKYRIVADNTYDWEYWEDPSGKIIYSSPSCKRLTGRDAQEFINNQNLLYEIVHHDDIASFTDHHKQAKVERLIGNQEFRIVLPDGSVRWIGHKCQPVFDDAGHYLGVRGSNRDITERKAAEIALRESRDKLEERVRQATADLSKTVDVLQAEVIARTEAEKSLQKANEELEIRVVERTAQLLKLNESLEQKIVERRAAEEKIKNLAKIPSENPYPIIRIGWDGKVLYANEVSEPYLAEWGMQVGGVAPENIRRVMSEAVDTCVKQEIELTHSGLVFSFVVAPIMDSYYCNFYGRDITDEKHAVDALLERERAISTLMSNLPGMAYRCRNDQDWTMEFVSEGSLELTGYAPSDIINNQKISYAQIIHADDRAKVWDGVQAALSEKQPYRLTYRIITAGGRQRWIWEQGRGIFSLDGELQALEGLMIDITDRMEAEEEVRRHEAQSRTLIEASPNALLLVAADGTMAMVNRQAEIIFGYCRAELIGRSVEMLTPRRIGSEHRRMCTEYAARPEQRLMGVGRDLFAVRKDGTEVPVEIGLSPIDTPDGSFTLVTLTDITLRKQAEEQVRESEANLQLQINRMPIAYILWSPEFRVLAWNPAAEKIFGYTEQEAMGKHSYDLVVPKEVQSHVDLIWGRLLGGDTTAHSVNENITKHGQTIICDWSNTPIKDHNGTVISVLSMTQDITERKLAEEQLHKVNRSLQVLSQCNEILVRATEEKDFLNAVCTSIVAYGGYRLVWVGFAEEDEKGVEVVRPAAYAGYENGYLKAVEIRWDDSELGRGPGGTAIRTGKPCVCGSIPTDPMYAPWREEAVRRGYVSTMALPLIDSGTTLGAMSIYSPQPNAFEAEEVALLAELANDLAYGINAIRTRKEREKAEAASLQLNKELIRKNKELESIIFVASHDLRSALVNVQGFSRELGMTCETVRTTLVKKDVPQALKEQLQKSLEEDIPETVDFITSSTAKIDSLLNGLLRLSRVGREELKAVQLDMNAMMAEVTRSVQIKIAQANAVIEVGSLPPCRGDHSLMSQVFSNLIDNSIKFFDKTRQGIIRISGRTENGQSVYCVEDNGVGIAPKYQEKVFEVFQRLVPDETPGEGLGLTIVRQIVERHNGYTWVESELGKGSRFFVALPSDQKTI